MKLDVKWVKQLIGEGTMRTRNAGVTKGQGRGQGP